MGLLVKKRKSKRLNLQKEGRLEFYINHFGIRITGTTTAGAYTSVYHHFRSSIAVCKTAVRGQHGLDGKCVEF